MFNKKILAVAVASTFVGGAAFAGALEISSGATPVYSSNMTIAAAGTGLTNTSVIAGTTDWGWSSGSNVFIRYDLSGATFTADPTAAGIGYGSNTVRDVNAALTTKASGGAAAANVIYQLTSNGTANTVTGANAMLTLAGIKVTSNASSVTITQSVYDTSANAVAAGSAGRLSTKTGTLISFTPSYSFTPTAGSANTADVSATLGPYQSFTGSVATQTAALGTIVIANSTTAGVANAALVSADAGNVLAAGSYITITGDFTAAANANGTYTGAALSRVFLGNSTCTVGATTGNVIANSVTATTAIIPMASVTNNTAGVAAGNSTLCLIASGNSAIPVASYTAAYTVTAATGYTASAAAAAAAVGSIARNGAQLITPWMTTAPGFISRVVLTNSSSAAATFTVAVKGEAGNTVTPVTASGTVPGNGMLIVNATDLATTSGASRFAATFTFASPRANIDGAYQVVNQSNGGVSNNTMVAPGTN